MQRGKLDDYIKKFEEVQTYILSQNRNYTKYYFIESFLSCLKEEIANALYIVRSPSLRNAINYAKSQEVYLKSLDRRVQAHSKKVVVNQPLRNKLNYVLNKKLYQLARLGVNKKSYLIARLIMVEMTARREEGLHYHCDIVYTSRHKCKQKHIFIMIHDEEENIRLKK